MLKKKINKNNKKKKFKTYIIGKINLKFNN